MNCNYGSFRPRHSAGLAQRLGRQVEGKERFMNFERRVVLCAAFILLILLSLAEGGRAQSEKGTVTGTVVDTSGGASGRRSGALTHRCSRGEQRAGTFF